MKKASSLLVVLLFVISIVPAFAEESTDTATSNIMAANAAPEDTNKELTITQVSDEEKREMTTDVAKVTTTDTSPKIAEKDVRIRKFLL